MARQSFGATASDFLMTVGPGGVMRVASGTLTMWTAETGGTRVNDLLLNSVPVTSIPVGSDGSVPSFQGPDGVTLLWADAGYGRVSLRANVNVAAEIAEAVEGHTPGVELGYAERKGVYAATANANVADMMIAVTGQGRPVEIEFNCPGWTHSAAGTLIQTLINVNGVLKGSASYTVPSANAYKPLCLRVRMILPVGVSHTITVAHLQGAAGTITYYGDNLGRTMWLSAVSR